MDDGQYSTVFGALLQCKVVALLLLYVKIDITKIYIVEDIYKTIHTLSQRSIGGRHCTHLWTESTDSSNQWMINHSSDNHRLGTLDRGHSVRSALRLRLIMQLVLQFHCDFEWPARFLPRDQVPSRDLK